MDKKILGKCPVCGADVVKTGKGYKCENNTGDSEGCKLYNHNTVGNRTMEDNEISILLEEKEILLDGFASKDGKAFSTVMRIGPDGHVDLDSNVAKCPNCGGDIRVNSRAFGCSNYHHPERPCKFTSWRNINGHKVTLAEIRQICSSGTTENTVDFYGEDGTVYQKKLSLSSDKLSVVKI